MKHRSGSPQSQQAAKKAYRERSGAVSNPNDGRVRNAARRIAKRLAQQLTKLTQEAK